MEISEKENIAWFTGLSIISSIFIEIYEAEHLKKENVFAKTIPNGFGVSIHYPDDRIDTDLIKDAGFKIVRKDIFWSQIEQVKGVYDYSATGYDGLTNSLIENEIRPYYILAY
ncbi:hypothetical protein V7088_27690, partial [Priestia megaterium]